MRLTSSDTAVAAVLMDVPPDFHEVPLDGQTEDRTAGQLRVLSTLGLTDPARREAVSLYLEALAIRLRAGDVAGTAFCAVALEGRASTATLTVAILQTRTADPGLALLGAAEVLRRSGRSQHQETLTVGGRAVLLATRDLSQPGATDAQAGRLHELVAVVAIPGRTEAVMLTLCTPSIPDAQTYRAVLLDIARSVRVESPAAIR